MTFKLATVESMEKIDKWKGQINLFQQESEDAHQVFNMANRIKRYGRK